MSRKERALVLVDSPVLGDRRVGRSIEALSQDPVLLNISDAKHYTRPVREFFPVLMLLIEDFLRGILHYPQLSKRLSSRVDGNPFAGMKSCVRWASLASRASHALSEMQSCGEFGAIHAHDLYCAVAATLARSAKDVPLIYDAHELEIHRNRKAGWLRVLIEYGLEQRVLRRAAEVRVVNHAIANVMREWYQMPPTVRVEYNDFFMHHEVSSPKHTPDLLPALVYVGKGVRGRQLEVLDCPSSELGFDVHVFFLGAEIPSHIRGNHWHYGPIDYEATLLKLVRARRCLMWCCLESTSLSYQFATPNKFFQALAVGMPVVASEGTYLAEIVGKHNLGPVFNGKNLGEIRAALKTEQFEQWVTNCVSFRTGLRTGKHDI